MSSTGITLVTGATGLLGNNVVRLLQARGERVRVLVRASSDHRALAGIDLEIATGDVGDEESVRQACQGVTVVIHCAGMVRIGWSEREKYQAVNVVGTRNVAAACHRAGARLIHVSTTDVFGRCSLTQPTDEDTPFANGPPVPYVITKRAAERQVTELSAAGLQAVTVNPSFMIGPWDWKPSSGKVLLAVSRGHAWISPRGWLSLCDARDVAEGILAARDRGVTGRRYLLGGRTMQWIDAFRLFADACGVRRPICRGGPLMLKIGGWGGDGIGYLTGHEPDVNSATIGLGWLPKNYSSARAEQELGYRIRPATETVADAWNWFQTNGYA